MSGHTEEAFDNINGTGPKSLALSIPLLLLCSKISRHPASMPHIAGVNSLCLWRLIACLLLHRLQDAKAGAATGAMLQCAASVLLDTRTCRSSLTHR